MALAQLTIQQKDQPNKQVKVRRLSGDKRFEMAVTSADGSAYRQPFMINRVSDPDVLRKLSAELQRRPTHFSIAVGGKSYAVKSEPISGTNHIRLHLSDDTVVVVDPGDDSNIQTSALVAVVIVIVVIVVIAVVTYIITVVSEGGSSDIEGEGGDREEGDSGDDGSGEGDGGGNGGGEGEGG